MTGDTLFTWDALATLAGASLLTFFVVQYTKALMDRWAPWLPTDLYAVVSGWLILTLAQLAGGASPADWRLYALAAANAFLVAAAAGQIHNKALNPPGSTTTVTGVRSETVTVTHTKGTDSNADA